MPNIIGEQNTPNTDQHPPRQQPTWSVNTDMHRDAWAECHSQEVFLAVHSVNVLSGTSATHHSSV